MKTLADECLDLLDGKPIPAIEIARRLGADRASVREAIKKLAAEGRAKAFVRGQGAALHLAPPDYAGRICVMCMAEFEPKKRAGGSPSTSRTCSNKCKLDLTRSYRDREAFVARVRETSSRPEHIARIKKEAEKLAVWKRSPEGRAEQAQKSMEAWADPYKKAKRSVNIKKALTRPDRRKRASEAMNAKWADPEMRKKLIDGMRNRKSRNLEDADV